MNKTYPINGNPICPHSKKECSNQDMDGYTDCSGCTEFSVISGAKPIIDSGRKILIVGAGKVGTAQLKEMIEKIGYNESECLLVENLDELKGLVSFGNREVQQRLEVEKMLEPQLLTSCSDFRNYNKHNSQQGWKNRPKHKR